MCAVRLLEDAVPILEGGSMPKTKTTYAVGTGVFLTIFGALCVTFDPTVAYALSLVATLAMKN
jgi:hypothetical protein